MRKTALASALVAVAALATPSHATYVRACAATGSVAFSPPLTVNRQTGTMTWTYNNTCATVDTGGASGLSGGPGQLVYTYDGSCISAAITGNNSTGTLYAETVMLRSATDRTAIRLWLVLLPDPGLCNVSSAFAVNVGPDLG